MENGSCFDTGWVMTHGRGDANVRSPALLVDWTSRNTEAARASAVGRTNGRPAWCRCEPLDRRDEPMRRVKPERYGNLREDRLASRYPSCRLLEQGTTDVGQAIRCGTPGRECGEGERQQPKATSGQREPLLAPQSSGSPESPRPAAPTPQVPARVEANDPAGRCCRNGPGTDWRCAHRAGRRADSTCPSTASKAWRPSRRGRCPRPKHERRLSRPRSCSHPCRHKPRS